MPNISTRRFVILEHTGTPSYKPGVHWDLLCEEGETLRAWEFPHPVNDARQQVAALPAHRLLYLEYEGPIAGERGSVRRIMEGTYELLQDSPMEWSVRLRGGSLQGVLQLTRSSLDQLVWDADFEPGC